MPFTISHAAAVLPLATGRCGQRLVPAALVIGSWVPDLPYFVPPYRGSDWSHSASGPFTIDLVLGLVVFAFWRLALQRPVADLAPRWLGDRLPPSRGLELRRGWWAALSVVLGAVTHVVWDTFTHPNRWGTTHIVTLKAEVGGLPLYKWLQFGSGAIGLVVLACWAAFWLRGREPHTKPTSPPGVRWASWAAVALVFTVTVVAVVTGEMQAGSSLEAAAFRTATTAISTTSGAAIVLCLLWHALPSGIRGRAVP